MAYVDSPPLKLTAGTGQIIENLWIKGQDKGKACILGNQKDGYVRDLTIRNNLFTGDPDLPDDANKLDWALRGFCFKGTLTIEGNQARNIREEHVYYLGGVENVHVRNEEAHDIGSQWFQNAPREYECFAGELDNVDGIIDIADVKLRHCATEFGRRPSWNMCFYAFQLQARDAEGNLMWTPGGGAIRGDVVPSKTDIVLGNLDIICDGFPHMASGTRSCDSTGVVLVQARKNFELGRSRLRCVNPDREAIQIMQVEDAIVKPIELWGGDIVLHDMDNYHVKIAPGRGDAEIRRRVLNSHTSTFVARLRDGYSH